MLYLFVKIVKSSNSRSHLSAHVGAWPDAHERSRWLLPLVGDMLKMNRQLTSRHLYRCNSYHFRHRTMLRLNLLPTRKDRSWFFSLLILLISFLGSLMVKLPTRPYLNSQMNRWVKLQGPLRTFIQSWHEDIKYQQSKAHSARQQSCTDHQAHHTFKHRPWNPPNESRP